MTRAYAGGLIDGCYFRKTAESMVVRTAREVGVILTVKRAGALAVTILPGGGLETVNAPNDAALARWACRLAVEFGQGVELQIQTQGVKL